jgi:hypothetical protein
MMNTEPIDDERRDAHLFDLLNVSAAMVGVCLTAIGLVGILSALKGLKTMIEELLAVGGVLFMIVCMLSFLGVRTKLGTTSRNLLLVIDVLFCLGLVVLVGTSIILAWVVM